MEAVRAFNNEVCLFGCESRYECSMLIICENVSLARLLAKLVIIGYGRGGVRHFYQI